MLLTLALLALALLVLALLALALLALELPALALPAAAMQEQCTQQYSRASGGAAAQHHGHLGDAGCRHACLAQQNVGRGGQSEG